MAAEGQPDKTLVSVIIPTKNAGSEFGKTLEALAQQAGDFELEVIVVDSGSADGTVELCRRYGARTMCIPAHEFSHGATRNLAIRSARGQFVALLVQDAVPADEHWLSALVEALRGDDRVAGAYSRQIGRPESDYLSRYVAGHWHRLMGGRRVQELGDAEALQKLPWDERRQYYAFDNVSSLIRRSVWQEHPLPEVAYGEDIVWARQVLEAGYRIIYEPASVVLHSHERPALYELRRTFVDARTMGLLLGGPAEPLSLAQARELLERFEAQRGEAEGDAQTLAEAVESCCAGEDWWRGHFRTGAVRRLFGPASPWPEENRQKLLRRLDERSTPWLRVALARRAPWRALRKWLLSERIAGALAGASLSRRDLDLIFDELWVPPTQDAVRGAVQEARDARPPDPLLDAETEMRWFDRQVFTGAQEVGELDWRLYWRTRQFSAAWAVGKRLGRASLLPREPAEERFWQDLIRRWAPGI